MTMHSNAVFIIDFKTSLSTWDVEVIEDHLKEALKAAFTKTLGKDDRINIISSVTGNGITITNQPEQVLRKLTRDSVVSVTDRELVGIYFADEDGSEVLMECAPERADLLIKIWNSIVDLENF